MLREQEIGEGGGEKQPGGDASELKTQSSRQTDRRKSGLHGPHGAACTQPPSEVPLASNRRPSLPVPPYFPRTLFAAWAAGGPACVEDRGPAGPAKGWRESLMSCAAH